MWGAHAHPLKSKKGSEAGYVKPLDWFVFYGTVSIFLEWVTMLATAVQVNVELICVHINYAELKKLKIKTNKQTKQKHN